VAGFLISAAAYADMVSASAPDAGRVPSPRVCSHTCTKGADCPCAFNCPNLADLHLPSVGFLPKVNADAGQTPPVQHPPTLTDGSNSLSLCLCALISLGLCTSGHCVKKLSFSFIPEWYHDGGPFQIGHSHAVMPNNLTLTPAYCFIQPACVVEDLIPQYRIGMVTALWRKSQFTPTALAARGPPNMS